MDSRIPLVVFAFVVAFVAAPQPAANAATCDSSGGLVLCFGTHPDPVKPGGLIVHRFLLANSGITDLTGVQMTYVVPQYLDSFYPDSGSCGGYCYPGDTLTWTVGTVPAGQSQAFTVTTNISSSAPDGAVILNSAVATASSGQSATVSRTHVVDTSPVLMLTGMADRDPVEPGGYLLYTLAYSNPSSVSAPGTILSATVPSGTTFISAADGGVHSAGVVSWALGNLSAGSSGQRQFMVQVSPSVGDGTVVTSEAMVADTSTPQNAARAPIAASVRTIANTPLTLTLAVSPNPAKPGNQLTYTFTLANRGGADLTGVQMTYVVPQYLDSFYPDSGSCDGYCYPGDTLTWSVGTVLAGQSHVFTEAPTLSSGTPDGTLIPNTVRATTGSGQSAAVSRTLVVDTSRVLMLTGTTDRDPVEPGGYLLYTLAYSNGSSVSAPGTILSATVPSGTTFISAADGGVHSAGVVSWALGNLSAGSSGQRQFMVQVSPSVGDGTVVTSEAMVADTSTPQNAARAPIATPVRTIANTPLTLMLAVSPNPAKPGNQLTYTFTLANRGGADLTGVQMTYVVPQYLDSFYPDSGSCDGYCYPGDTLTWSVGTVLAGQSHVFTEAPTLSSGTPDGTLIPNTVRATTGSGQIAAVSRTLVVDTSRVLMLTGTTDRDPVEPGGYLLYTLAYSNASSVSAPGTILSATVPSGTTFISAADGGVHSAGVVSWALGNLSAGSSGQRQFMVQVSPSTGDGTVVTSEATVADTSTPQNAARAPMVTSVRTIANTPLTLTLAVSPNPAKPGNQLTYTFTLANRGGADLTGVQMTYVVPQYLNSFYPASGSCGGTCYPGDMLTWSIGTVLAGQSQVFTVTTNASSGSSAPPDGTLITSAARATSNGGHRTSASCVLIIHRTVTLTAPIGFSAEATSASTVALSWSAVSGATGYEIQRSSGGSAFGSPIIVGAVTSTSNSGLATDTTYLYRVRALATSAASGFSAVDAATTTIFTPDPLSGVIRASHVAQIRTAIDAMRAAAGLGGASFTYTPAAGSLIRGVDVSEMRNALDAARLLLGLPQLGYTDASLTGRMIRALHFEELRNALK